MALVGGTLYFFLGFSLALSVPPAVWQSHLIL
jgi:hypothetical protein